MPNLVLMEQGLTLSVEGECLVVRRSDVTIQKVRLQEVKSVLLFGRIQPTIDAIRLLLLRGVPTVFLTRLGEYRGRLEGELSKNVELRVRQYGRLQDPAFVAAIAAAIVRGKLQNQRNLLLRVQRERRLESMANGLLEMRRLSDSLERADQVESIRGLEGRGAAVYFPLYGDSFVREEFRFTRRSRRPPRDPANAMLSFGYTLLGTAMENAVLQAGLDPQAGFLHEPAYGRPSLMLDLIEEFRPLLVDSLVLRLVNRREIDPGDFEDPRLKSAADPFEAIEEVLADAQEDRTPPVYLSETGRKIFFRAFQARLDDVLFHPRLERRFSYRQILMEQVYHLCRVVEGQEAVYTPFVPK